MVRKEDGSFPGPGQRQVGAKAGWQRPRPRLDAPPQRRAAIYGAHSGALCWWGRVGGSGVWRCGGIKAVRPGARSRAAPTGSSDLVDVGGLCDANAGSALDLHDCRRMNSGYVYAGRCRCVGDVSCGIQVRLRHVMGPCACEFLVWCKVMSRRLERALRRKQAPAASDGADEAGDVGIGDQDVADGG